MPRGLQAAARNVAFLRPFPEQLCGVNTQHCSPLSLRGGGEARAKDSQGAGAWVGTGILLGVRGRGVPGASARHPGLGALGLPFPGCGVSGWCRGNRGETPWGRRWSFRELPAGAAAGGSRSGQGRPWGPPHEEPLLRPWGCRERVLRPHTMRGHVPQVGPENSSPASLPPRIGELESGKEGAF